MVLNKTMLAEGYFDQRYVEQGQRQAPAAAVARRTARRAVDQGPPPCSVRRPSFDEWHRLKYPMDDFLNGNDYVPFNESLNEGLALGGARDRSPPHPAGRPRG